MMEKNKCRFIVIVLLWLFSLQISFAQTQICHLTDNGKALVNPGMGWQLYYYSNVLENYGSKLEPEDTVEEFPGVGLVFLRVPWSFIEPEKDKFNWELLDTPAQRWIDAGKRVALCISSTENWTRTGTPQWVWDEGAKCREVNGFLEPEYDDSIFLSEVNHCVKRMAERYDGNPNVDYLYIGHFGMWGEGHTEVTTPIHGITWGYDTQKKYIDIYTQHFKKTQLCLSDDFAGHNKPGYHFPITDYAFSKGVTLVDCSILVQPYPRHWYHAEMAQMFWPKMPVILEHEHYLSSKERGAWNPDLLLKAVEDYHASYLSIHCWPRTELNENREIIDRINRRMGYRFQLTQAEWPSSIQKSVPFIVKYQLNNAGVAPCYKGAYPCFTIKNDKGGIVSVLVDTKHNVRQLKPTSDKPNPQRFEQKFTVAQIFKNSMGTFSRTCPTGNFKLYFSIGSIDGTPELELPYDYQDGHKRYLLGTITIAQ